MRVLAIDQGTTNTKALVIAQDGTVLARASAPLTTSYPQDGWAEQSAAAIWASVQAVIAEVAATGCEAIAIANQRETLVLWDAETSQPLTPAMLWQCRRTAPACAALVAAGHDAAVQDCTGLQINPLFPASKLAWALESLPEVQAAHAAGRLRAGTVDAWLIWNLTGGAVFATDHSNASRTQLFNLETRAFSPEMGAIFGAPLGCLPTPRASDAGFGCTVAGASALPAGVPIAAVMGDSHAALFGHGIRQAGLVKATYGTGSSLMTLTATKPRSRHGLSATIAWSDQNGTAYALEGNITVSAQAAAFMAQLLGQADARALSALAQTVESAGGVQFIPALAGLGAPHWDDAARGTVSGMTHATKPAHLARATFEAIAQQIADVFAAMEADLGAPLAEIRADGGASGNGFLMQLQADLLGRPVQCCTLEEIGAFGVAAMAFAARGVTLAPSGAGARFAPRLPDPMRRTARAAWAKALTQARA